MNTEELEEKEGNTSSQETTKRPYSFREEIKLLLPNRDYWVMQALIYINVAIWLLMVVTGSDPVDPSIEDLIGWGANVDVLTIGLQQYWRLFTSCFLHIGIIHLLFNMYALLYIGSLLEKVIGHRRFLFAYLITGLISSLASIWWNDMVISAGASGAIFGMYGIYITLLLSNKLLDKKQQKEMLTSMAIFVGYNLLYGMKENIDNAGHIGGLLSGLLIGACFLPALLHSANRLLARISESVLPVLLFVILFFAIHADTAGRVDLGWDEEFDEELMEILTYLDKGTNVVAGISNELSDEEIISELETFKLIMDSCRTIINEYPQTHEMDEMNSKLISYFDAFTGLKIEYARIQIEYIRSGYAEEYEAMMIELDDQIEQLNAYYEEELYGETE